MSQYEFDDILQKYLDGKCSPAEENIVLEWYKTFINQTEIDLSPNEKQALEHKIWERIEFRTIDQQRRPAIVRLFTNSWMRRAVAACLVLAALAGGYWYLNQPVKQNAETFGDVKIPEDYITKHNDTDTLQFLTLSDGSVVELQPQSSLHYPIHFKGNTRDVYLTGNSFFRVAHDTARHFIVHTGEGLLAEVLGTSFYVFHNKASNEVQVAVVTGKVSVYKEKQPGDAGIAEGKNRVILTPNQKVSFRPSVNQLITSLVEEPQPLETVNNKETKTSFVFDETQLSQVIKVLESAYGISIQTENDKLNRCHFTGDLTKQNLYDKLDIICKSLQSSYEIKGTVIYLKGEGCD